MSELPKNWKTWIYHPPSSDRYYTLRSDSDPLEFAKSRNDMNKGPINIQQGLATIRQKNPNLPSRGLKAMEKLLTRAEVLRQQDAEMRRITEEQSLNPDESGTREPIVGVNKGSVFRKMKKNWERNFRSSGGIKRTPTRKYRSKFSSIKTRRQSRKSKI